MVTVLNDVSKTGGTVPKRYVQLFANYDRAWVDKCRTLKFHAIDKKGQDVERPVLCVFATPERAFAQAALQIARKRECVVDPKNVDVKVVPLPMISITRLVETLDTTRYNRNKMNRLMRTRDNEHFYGMWFPSPYDITFQIDLWTRTISDQNDLSNQIHLWLRSNEFYLTVNHPMPFNERIVLTEYQGATSGDEIDPRNEKQRVLRRTFTFVVHGWLCPPADEYGIIRRIVTELWDNTDPDDPDLLDTIVVPPGEEGEPVPATSSLIGGTIIGDAEAGSSYGNFVVPAQMAILGMQASILGTPHSGDDIELQLTLDGGAQADKRVVIPAGDLVAAVTFDAPIAVIAGNVLGVYCSSVGSIDPGSWIQWSWDVELQLYY